MLRRAARGLARARCFSAIDDALGVDDTLRSRATELVAALRSRGFYSFPILTGPQTAAMRSEAAKLYAAGKFSQSYSEVNGVRVAKPGVHSIELDGDEWAACPSLLCYTREVLLTLPAPAGFSCIPGSHHRDFVLPSHKGWQRDFSTAEDRGPEWPAHCELREVGADGLRFLARLVLLDLGR